MLPKISDCNGLQYAELQTDRNVNEMSKSVTSRSNSGLQIHTNLRTYTPRRIDDTRKRRAARPPVQNKGRNGECVMDCLLP